MPDNDNQPVTRSELREELEALEHRLIETMCDMQTETLRGFQHYIGTHSIEINMRALQDRDR